MLPKNIKEAQTTNVFKTLLKEWIWKNIHWYNTFDYYYIWQSKYLSIYIFISYCWLNPSLSLFVLLDKQIHLTFNSRSVVRHVARTLESWKETKWSWHKLACVFTNNCIGNSIIACLYNHHAMYMLYFQSSFRQVDVWKEPEVARR